VGKYFYSWAGNDYLSDRGQQGMAEKISTLKTVKELSCIPAD
jgi:hypothetical protein